MKAQAMAIAGACLLAEGGAIGCGDGDSGAPAEPLQVDVNRAPRGEASKRPNIVFIYTDDQEAATFNRR